MGNCFPTPVTSFSAAYKLRTASDYNAKTQERGKASSSRETGPPNNLVDDDDDDDDDAFRAQVVDSRGKIVTPNLKMYNLGELKSATRNFRPDSVVGEGGFGRVFKGWVDPTTLAPSKVGVGMLVAVKKSNPDSEQGLKEWQAEVKFLGKFSHPNLVKLLGYCWEEKKFLLVYEYMQKGSLESHLFRNGAKQLSWKTRLKIVIGAARGLAFLHTTEKQVIYRDFKTANILLDADYNAKLSDFGLAKLGPINGNSHVTTGVVGTYGYVAPEYIATGHLYLRSDVYGFGVILLEILTGRRVVDLNRPHRENNLVEWARPYLQKKSTLKRIMDPKLEHKYPLKAAFEAATLTLKCLESDPKNRPFINDVLNTLEKINTIYMSPKEAKTSNVKDYNECRDSDGDHHRSNSYGNTSAAGNRTQGNRTSLVKPNW